MATALNQNLGDMWNWYAEITNRSVDFYWRYFYVNNYKYGDTANHQSLLKHSNIIRALFNAIFVSRFFISQLFENRIKGSYSLYINRSWNGFEGSKIIDNPLEKKIVVELINGKPDSLSISLQRALQNLVALFTLRKQIRSIY
jgi:hypothetical protein